MRHEKEDRRSCSHICTVLVYFNSRSFRLAAKSLAPIEKRSHVAVWKWVQRYADCADRFRTDRRLVSTIFVDETLLQIDGHNYWLWIAYEPAIDTCLAMHLSRERIVFVCYTTSSSSCGEGMAGSQYLQTALDGTTRLAGGCGCATMSTVQN